MLVTWQEFKQDLMLMAVRLAPLWPDSHADFKKRIVLPLRQQARNTEFPSEGAGLTVHPGPVPSWPSRQTASRHSQGLQGCSQKLRTGGLRL